jgi:hypothetical protein
MTLHVRKTALLGCMPEPDVYEYRTAPGRSDFLVYRKKKQ